MSHAACAPHPGRRGLLCLAGLGATLGPTALLVGCAGTAPAVYREPEALYRAVNRIGWGATQSQLDQATQLGWSAYVERQLKADPRAPLAPAVQTQVDALGISQRDPIAWVLETEELRRNQDKAPTEAERAAARQAYQAALNLPAREAGHRQLLRQLYAHVLCVDT
eukprot:Opistho-1_new@52499